MGSAGVRGQSRCRGLNSYVLLTAAGAGARLASCRVADYNFNAATRLLHLQPPPILVPGSLGSAHRRRTC